MDWLINNKVDVLILLVMALAISTILLIKGYFKYLRSFLRSLENPISVNPIAQDSVTLAPISYVKSATVPTINGLVCGATWIGDKSKQEDALEFGNMNGNLVLAVADGISSSSNAHLASQVAVRTFVDSVRGVWDQGRDLEIRDIRSAFKQAQAKVQLQTEGMEDCIPPATTLIAAVEQRDRLLIGYLGDGAAVLARGNLTWINNQLYPHTGNANAITGFLGTDSCQTEPTVVDLPKYWPDGLIILLGSDGALVQGSVLTTAQEILDEIQLRVTNNNGDTQLEEAISNVLKTWVEKKLTTDDNRTLGILISREALANWIRLRPTVHQD